MAEADRGIDPALKELGEFAGMDRCYIFRFDGDMTTLDNSHEWCAPDIEPQIDNLQSIPINELPWFMNQIQNNDIVYIPCIEKLPAAAAVEKEHWLSQDIRSVVTVPMHSGGALIGFMGFDAVRTERPLKEQDFSLLQTAASIIASAIIVAENSPRPWTPGPGSFIRQTGRKPRLWANVTWTGIRERSSKQHTA